MTHTRFTLSLLALGLPAVVALAACQAPPASTVSGTGIAVVKARLAQADRRVMTLQDRPLKASDIRVLRLSLTRQSDATLVEQDVASPGAEVAVAFRHLHADTDYVIEARAFTTDEPSPGAEVAYASSSFRIDNYLNTALTDLTLQLGDTPFNGQMTATGVQVLDGDYANTATTAVRVEYDTVTSIAGGVDGYLDGPADSARFKGISGIAEADGKLYLADSGNHVIRMYDPTTGQVSTVFGDPAATAGYLDDPTGTGPEAFDEPFDVVYDGEGNLYVADRDNYVIRQIELASGKVTTLVGQAGVAGFSDTPASPTFGSIEAIAYASDALYVADTTNHTIRMIDLSTLDVSTIAGMPGQSGHFDTVDTLPLQEPTNARFTQPKGIAVRFDGGDRYIYVADTDNHVLRKIVTSNGVTTVSTLAGVVDDNTTRDGLGSEAGFRLPMGLTLDGSDGLYVADNDSGALRHVTRQGRVTTYVGKDWDSRGWRDGPQRSALMEHPREVFFSGTTLYFYDGNRMLRKVE